MTDRRHRPGRWAGGLLLVVVAAVATLAASSTGAAGSDEPWEGAWTTNFGEMQLTQTGSSVEGTYTHDEGHLVGTATGNTLHGTWDEAPTRAGGDAGSFTFTLRPGGTWDGTWGYTGQPESGDWSGSCVAGPCLEPEELAVTFEIEARGEPFVRGRGPFKDKDVDFARIEGRGRILDLERSGPKLFEGKAKGSATVVVALKDASEGNSSYFLRAVKLGVFSRSPRFVAVTMRVTDGDERCEKGSPGKIEARRGEVVLVLCGNRIRLTGRDVKVDLLELEGELAQTVR